MQISVLGTRPAIIRKVEVRGALSGVHSGRLRAYSGARGASFVPAQPFAEGEEVTATLTLSRHRVRRWTFTIAQAGRTPPILNITSTQPGKLEHFVTEPALVPPRITVRRRSGGQRVDLPHAAALAGRASGQHDVGHAHARRPGRADDRR